MGRKRAAWMGELANQRLNPACVLIPGWSRSATARTFDQVKESILAVERAKFIDDQRDAALAPVKNDPATKVNQAAVDALIITIDPEKASKASAGEKPR